MFVCEGEIHGHVVGSTKGVRKQHMTALCACVIGVDAAFASSRKGGSEGPRVSSLTRKSMLARLMVSVSRQSRRSVHCSCSARRLDDTPPISVGGNRRIEETQA